MYRTLNSDQIYMLRRGDSAALVLSLRDGGLRAIDAIALVRGLRSPTGAKRRIGRCDGCDELSTLTSTWTGASAAWLCRECRGAE